MNIFPWTVDENWICDRIANEWNLKVKAHSCNSIDEADILWILSGWAWRSINPSILTSKKIILTVHHIVPDKFTNSKLQDFQERDFFIDAYHVPCEKTKASIEHLTNKPIHIIPYWVNGELWRPLENKKELQKKYNIPSDRFIVGSFQKDTEGSDLKTPKLEKGPDIFCDIIERLNPKPHVVLGGWRREYIINRLKSKNINFSFFELIDLNSLNELYNCLDLYLVTSRHEGGPQAILESVATNTPILSTDVGIANHALSEKCIMSNEDEFVDFIEQGKLLKYSEIHKVNCEKVNSFKIPQAFDLYLEMFKSL